MRSYIKLLRENPGFARLWYAQVVSLFGDWFNIIALSGLVAHYTDNSGLAVSGLLLARVLPPFIVSPFAGVLIDRFDRKRLLIISAGVREALQFGQLSGKLCHQIILGRVDMRRRGMVCKCCFRFHKRPNTHKPRSNLC